ncbi:MAG: hypothetical protein HDR88_02260 [Bacteroides sp.]|nr:hypothetical protein [Bacteroides sp.]
MADYTLTLNSQADYRMIKKLLKAFEGASIKPIRKQKRKSSIEKSLEEARNGKVVGPFYSAKELMDDLLS